MIRSASLPIAEDLVERLPGPGVSDPRGLFFQVREKGDALVCEIPSNLASAHRTFLVRRFQDPGERWRAEDALMFTSLGLLFLWGTHLGVDFLLLGRRTRLDIRTLLVMAFVFAALLPLTGAGAIAEQHFAEKKARAIAQKASELESDVRAIDRRVWLDLASLTAAIRSFPGLAATKAVLRAEAVGGNPRIFFQAVLSLVQTNFRGVVNLLILVGDHGLVETRSISADPGVKPKEQDLSGNLFGTLVGSIGSRFLRQRNPDFSGAGKSRKGDRGEFAAEELKGEILRDSVRNLLGPEAFLRFFHFPDLVTHFNSLTERHSFLGVPLFPLEKPSWFLVLQIKELAVVLRQLRGHLKKNRQLLGDPRVLFALQGYSVPNKGFPASPEVLDQVLPRTSNLARLVYQKQTEVRLQASVGRTKRLIEIQPAQSFRGVVGGQEDLVGIEKQQATWEGKARTAWWTALALILGVALAAAGRFLRPLQHLAEGIGAIHAGRYGHRLDEGLEGEFGELSRSFNFLARSLEEREVLQRYVTESVRQAVRRDSEEDAPRPRELEATILFAGLRGFAAFRQREDIDTVFRLLLRQLGWFDEAVSRFGGEIDKIIGEKVMVVFRHPDFGSPEQAVAAAVAVAREIATRGAAEGLPVGPVMGIGTGPVISGMMGSRQVRLDHTVIGDPVNLASRLCGVAYEKGDGSVVASGETRRLLPPEQQVEALGQLSVKGKARQIEAFRLRWDEGPAPSGRGRGCAPAPEALPGAPALGREKAGC